MTLLQTQLFFQAPSLREDLHGRLERMGVEVVEEAKLALLFDVPFGYSFDVLEAHPTLHWVILTENPCPEYQLDLWETQPYAVLSHKYTFEDLLAVLLRVQQQKRLFKPETLESLLTPAERKVVRRAALPGPLKHVADRMNLAEKTVKTHLTHIYSKLELRDRQELMAYYFGLWHLLERDNFDRTKVLEG